MLHGNESFVSEESEVTKTIDMAARGNIYNWIDTLAKFFISEMDRAVIYANSGEIGNPAEEAARKADRKAWLKNYQEMIKMRLNEAEVFLNCGQIEEHLRTEKNERTETAKQYAIERMRKAYSDFMHDTGIAAVEEAEAIKKKYGLTEDIF